MLVLTRKVGERILLGDQIKITVVRVTSSGVRLGIEAPAEIAVVREEVNREDTPPPTPPTRADKQSFRPAVE